ncbi:hypothetical protein WCU84_20030 [Dickeya chrysanthemi]|uniref:Uncharacterized protein n=1 Tax=Dickeya chrysanthemi TaxID=556 RepID=A0ABU8JR40_DICCH
MSKLFRHVVLYVSCFIETVWAGVISVVAGLMTGGVQIILALAKFSQFLFIQSSHAKKSHLNQKIKLLYA